MEILRDRIVRPASERLPSHTRKTLERFLVEKTKWAAGLPHRREMMRLRELDADAFWAYQASRLQAMYADAVAHVPYYRDLHDDYPRSLDIDPAHPLDALRQLPVLPKALVRRETERFWRQPPVFGTGEHTTGGTTGSGTLRVRAGIRDRGITNAILDARYAEIAGTPSPRILRLSGFIEHGESEERLSWHIPGTKFTYLSVYGLSHTNRDAIVDLLQRFRPQVIHGFPSAIHQLALLFRDDPLPGDVPPFVVVSVSETLLDAQRVDIETHLRTRVFDEYGSQEGQHLVLQCAEGAWHIHPARGIVELLELDSDAPVAAGELGRVVVTGLVNRSMPLLRYDIGDTAMSTGYATSCLCGCLWPTIGRIYGRIDDLPRTRDGRQFHFLAMKSITNVKESQVIQKSFDRFTCRVVVDDTHKLDLPRIKSEVTAELQKQFNVHPRVEVSVVDRLERTTRGKFRAFIVDMDE